MAASNIPLWARNGTPSTRDTPRPPGFMDAGDSGTDQDVPHPGIASSETSGKRRGDGAASRSKRAKYAAAACNECKRRKLKCTKEDDETACNRCLRSEVSCSFDPGDRVAEEPRKHKTRMERVERELADLRQQVAHLASRLDGQRPALYDVAVENGSTPSQASVMSAGTKERKEVQFVGTTRPQFGLNVARAALSTIPDNSEGSRSPSASPAPFPQQEPEYGMHSRDPLLLMEPAMVNRLLGVFQEEVEAVYPVLDTASLRAQSAGMISRFKSEHMERFDGRISQKDIHLLKIVLATALVMERHGKNDLSRQLLATFEDDAARITSPSDVDLQEAQVFAIMSIYHFHCDEELLAYRCIGIASRMVLEMGLHRRRSLYENYPDPEHQALAIRVFWCVYALDRRWSFGVGLSFALVDRDIDPHLPEPPRRSDYFCCLVSYGKLCSKVWEVLPQYGSRSEVISPEMEATLDGEIQTWYANLPDRLRLSPQELEEGTGTRSQYGGARLLRNMRTLLYLRGNYIRCLIHRHHVMSTSAVARDPTGAQLVVSLAQESIRVLINLNNTSDVYARQQVAYNYFLVSAISILLLAVCQAPSRFAHGCRRDFFAAIDLVRGFSRLSLQGRRLWSSLRGLVSRLESLGITSDKPHAGRRRQLPALHPHAGVTDEASTANASTPGLHPNHGAGAPGTTPADHYPVSRPETSLDLGTPDMNLMGDELLGVFDTFGAGYMDSSNVMDGFDPSLGLGNAAGMSLLDGQSDNLSQYFVGLF